MSYFPKSLCILCDCGLGDFFRYYFTTNAWKATRIIKKRHKKTNIKAIVASSNTGTKTLLERLPFIDKIIEHPWSCSPEAKARFYNIYNDSYPLIIKPELAINRTKFEKTLSKTVIQNSKIVENMIKDLDLDKEPPNKIEDFLSFKDKEYINTLNLGKFVLIHPFAGTSILKAVKEDKYIPLIDILIDKFKYNVIIVGATNIKRNKIYNKECFDYNRPGLLNLVNNKHISIALCAYLSQKAKTFIGTRSCYFNSAMAGQAQKIILFVHKNQAKIFTSLTQKRWPGYRQPITIPIDSKQNNLSDIYERVLTEIKK